MSLFHHNRPNHSLLLMPVRLGNERWPKNKVRVLSCDAEGHLFTQLIGRSTYQRISQAAQQMEMSQNNYATIYWDTGTSRFKPLLVKIEDKESWALERILEHAFRSAVIPDMLSGYPEEIIRLGESKYRKLLSDKTGEALKTWPTASPKVLDRLPYYREKDIEASVPIYKAENTFPLIILKRLPQTKDMPLGQQQLLILDSDGDLAVIALPSAQVNRAERKRCRWQKKGKEVYLICLRKPDGIFVDVMEANELQKHALEVVAQRFEETDIKKRPLSGAVKKVLNKAREKISS